MKPNSDGEMIPAVAEKYEASEDGPTTIPFTLRDGVKFHNGQTGDAGGCCIFHPIAAPLCRRVRTSSRWRRFANVEMYQEGDRHRCFQLQEPNNEFISYT